MENSNQILENKPSKTKTLLGGLFAVGILAGLLMLGSGNFQSAEKLKAEVIDTSAIISLTPTAGKAGDLVDLAVKNLENFSEEEIEVFFGEEFAEINAFSNNSSDDPLANLFLDIVTTIAVEVPSLAEIGNYTVRIITPNGIIESAEQFEFTKAGESDPNPDPDPDLDPNPNPDPDPDSNPDSNPNPDSDSDPDSATPTLTPTTEIPISPPQNLQAASTANGIELSWEEPTDGEAAFYEIYYGTKSGSYIHRVISENLFEIFSKNLASGQHYFFAATAVNLAGDESGGSNETSAIYSPSASAKLVLAKVGATTSIFHAASPKPAPVRLSEEGPAAAILISIFATLGISIFIFRKKIFARN